MDVVEFIFITIYHQVFLNAVQDDERATRRRIPKYLVIYNKKKAIGVALHKNSSLFFKSDTKKTCLTCYILSVYVVVSVL